MRRNVGISGLQRVQKEKEQFRSIGTQLAQTQLVQLKENMQTFKENLQVFAQKYRQEIIRDPHFRTRFQLMCNSIGVDPLASSKGFWGELLGVGDYYYELGIHIAETCMATREQNGGLINMQELQRTLQTIRKHTSGLADEITRDDIKRAVKLLGPLGNGFSIIHVGEQELVQSTPYELSSDVSNALAVAETNGGMVDARLLELQLNWTQHRITMALNTMMQDGLTWIDEQAPGGVSYWVMAFVNIS